MSGDTSHESIWRVGYMNTCGTSALTPFIGLKRWKKLFSHEASPTIAGSHS